MSAATAPAASRGILQDVVSSIFEPGTNSGLVKAMNYSFYALFVTLIGMIFLTGGNIHVCALFGLSVGLFLSIKWFLVQIADVEAERKREKVAEDAKEAAASKGKTE